MADEKQVKFTAVQASAADEAAECNDIYANGVAIGYTLSDVNILFSVVGTPKCRVHMSLLQPRL